MRVIIYLPTLIFFTAQAAAIRERLSKSHDISIANNQRPHMAPILRAGVDRTALRAESLLFVRLRSFVSHHLERFRLNTFLMVYNFTAIRHLTFHIPTLKFKASTIFILNFQFLALQYLENR